MNADEYIVPVLLLINLVAGFGGAILIAIGLRKITGKPSRIFLYIVILNGIYLVECVAFAAGMCTQVFSVGLALVWGTILGLWLRGRAPERDILKQALYVSIYGCLPTASFCILIPVIRLISGGHILNAAEGIDFGIPEFLPWPLNTILGFFAAILVVTVVFKTIITTGIAYYLIHRKESIIGNACLKDLD